MVLSPSLFIVFYPPIFFSLAHFINCRLPKRDLQQGSKQASQLANKTVFVVQATVFVVDKSPI